MTNLSRASDDTLALLFDDARTHAAWADRPVSHELLQRLYALVRMGPTGGNGQPLRLVFVESAAAKERLKPALFPLNVDKTMQAPVTAIVAADLRFYEHMPTLFPARAGMREQLAGMGEAVVEKMSTQSATLQAGYLIIAARALGLDCGPMGGFDAAAVDRAFFEGTSHKTLLLVNLGYGLREKVHPRLPRLSFEQACRIE